MVLDSGLRVCTTPSTLYLGSCAMIIRTGLSAFSASTVRPVRDLNSFTRTLNTPTPRILTTPKDLVRMLGDIVHMRGVQVGHISMQTIMKKWWDGVLYSGRFGGPIRKHVYGFIRIV